jgi:hypothetical protein
MVGFDKRSASRNCETGFSREDLAFVAGQILEKFPSFVGVLSVVSNREGNSYDRRCSLSLVRKNLVVPEEILDIFEFQHSPAAIHTHSDAAGHERFVTAKLLRRSDIRSDFRNVQHVGNELQRFSVLSSMSRWQKQLTALSKSHRRYADQRNTSLPKFRR